MTVRTIHPKEAALRAALTERDGRAFTLRAFHDRFLGYGAIPVTLIARDMLGQELSLG